MDLNEEYIIRGKIIGISVHMEGLLEDLLSKSVSMDEITHYRIKAYFLRHIDLKIKVRLLRKLTLALDIKDAFNEIYKRVDDLIMLRNILAHEDSILIQTDDLQSEDKIGFYHLDHKRDGPILITLANTIEEWDSLFQEYESFMKVFTLKFPECSELIFKSRI